VIKTSAATTRLFQHTGRALVFEDYEKMLRRVDDPALPVEESSVLVLKNAGPVGAPGMAEWEMLPWVAPWRSFRQGTGCTARRLDLLVDDVEIKRV
jgi:dihydroxyacid dehydratase/phosphogluconate dehydratase